MEHDLNGPDLAGGSAGALGASAATAVAKGLPKWQLYCMMACVVVMVGAVVIGLVDKLANWNSLPGCDEQRTRDTLSNLNKAQKINASSYNFIKEVSTSETEVRCVANLALYGGGATEYDFRIFRDGGAMKVEISNVRKGK